MYDNISHRLHKYNTNITNNDLIYEAPTKTEDQVINITEKDTSR